MKIFKTFFNTLLFLVAPVIYSQSQVTGIIKDDQGTILPGVNVIEKGTNNGTVSDFDGNFTIEVNENAILVFSYLGFQKQEISVDSQSVINVILKGDQESLEEVVVIGYGAVDRDKVSSSISTVEGEELTKIVASNPAESLQGKAAGVQVLSGGGNPGASPQILIRGVTSNNGTSPLIVLDGVPQPQGTSLNFLNPADIKNFQILKDASASAIYGSRASNGVVLITTKRGKQGKASINVDFSQGYQRLEKIELANAEEYIQVMNLRRTNDGSAPLYNAEDFTADTDWWDETIENFAPVTNLNIRASGGSENAKFSASMSYFNQDSNYSKGNYEKITARFNTDFKLSDKVTLKQDLNPRLENFGNTPNLLYSILRIDPLTEVYLPQEERTGNIFSIYAPSNNQVPNPVGNVARLFNETKFFALISNTQLNYEITDALTFNSQLGLNINKSTQDIFNPTYFTTPNQQQEINNISRRVNENFDYVFNNTINYTQTFNKHYINLLGGVLFDSQKFNYVSAFREDIPSDENPDLRYLDAATGEGISVGGNEAVETIFSGIFRGIYSYDNRYFFTGTLRADESSKFAKGNRLGVFPSVSVAWDIDSESFFDVDFINNLRLKAGYGQIGNQNINRNGQFFAIGTGNYVFGGERVVTNFLSQFGNPNLKWETVEDKNFGITAALFNNALDFTIEYYEKTSKDLLFNVELPNYTGIPGRVAQNVGSFKSKGWDIQIGYTKALGDFELGLDLNVSTNESRAVALAPGNEQLFGQNRSDLGNRFIKITELGELVGLFYGFETDGIFQNQTEINSHSSETGQLIQPDAQPGDLKFVDINGDGILNDDDLTTIGNPFPDFYGGFSTNLKYKNVDFSMQWYGTLGNEVFNYTRTFINAGTQDVNIASGTLGRVWTSDNPNAEFPRLTLLDRNGNYQRPSSLFIEDASYLRLRNVQLGYNLNVKGLQKARIYISGQNLLTLTKYSGFDPEVGAGGDIINDFGVDYARFPVTRTYLLGFNLTF
ncbi:SusC/RagA family TonB-linked outer membrane protein [Leeuwenhoekiella sp. ZYFB001]|uniref:SusC/RagA family TonB-linked outer membrane protein n=1 Tax=Leeuwenhoekiella sp. ZYFB001 TaxID=2719912 RepID=UPI0014309A7F|nr:TonB-dependent receptor [Leeuwenhoekiella sp. ZYFB001]